MTCAHVRDRLMEDAIADWGAARAPPAKLSRLRCVGSACS